MKRKLTGIIFITLFWLPALAQTKSASSAQQVWLGYFNQTRIGTKWGFWFDAQLRTKDDFFEDLSVSIFRPGFTYYVNEALKLTAGDSYIRFHPQDQFKVARPEHRPWQQVQWHTRYGRNRTMQYLRLEERFRRKIAPDSTLADGNNFNFRLRYNFLWQIPLSKGELTKGSFSLILNNEIHIAFGKEVVYNYFDQNRFFGGLSLQTNARDNLQFGYLNVFQQLPAGNRYRSTHAARIAYFHNLDLRKKTNNR